MQRSETLPAGLRLATPRITLPRIRGDLVAWYWLPALGYLVIAVIAVYGTQTIVGDAYSRVANASYVIFSRDPHLAAIGFVWSPLPSMLAIPLLPLSAVFPGLLREGFAANVLSALFMALAVYQLRGITVDLAISRLAGVGLTLVFALHPMIALFGGNGMSEAILLALLMLVVRYLMRWLHDGATGPLVVSGVALALAYTTRYEAAIAAAGATAVVAAVGLVRAGGRPRERLSIGLAHAAVFCAPVAMTFAAWHLTSWWITGNPFEILSSTYGNSATVARYAGAIQDATGQGTPAAVGYVAAQVVGLAPALLPLLALAGLASLLRRDARLLAPLAVLGSILVFQDVAFLAGSTFGWLRFSITAIPLAVLAGALLIAPRSVPVSSPTAGGRWGGARRAAHGGAVVLLATVTLTCLLAGTVTGAMVMADPRYGNGETSEQIAAITSRTGPDAPHRYGRAQYLAAGEVAHYLDGLRLDDGSVLLDAASGFPVILQSADPRQFVITPDRDFARVLADPVAFDVRYVLVPANSGGDAIVQRYPTIYADGAGMGEVVRHFDSQPESPGWKVIRLFGS